MIAHSITPMDIEESQVSRSYPMPLRSSTRQVEHPTFFTILTLVLWMGCLTVGALGIAIPFERPMPPVKEAAVIQAETLHVELTEEVALPPEPLAAAEPSLLAPAPPDALIQPQIAAPIPVAEPLPSVAFAVPVEGPTKVVQVAQASYSRPAKSETPVVAAAAPVAAPRALTFGQGEGKQPAPVYPRRAQREGQEGTVLVRFTVGQNGRVLAAEAASPSPWPLLNEEALRVIRQRWRFADGAVRLYEVAIRFELRK